MSQSKEAISPEHIEQLIRQKFLAQVSGFAETTAANYDLQLLGIDSLELIVVLSQLEQELNITLLDAFVARGYTISNISEAVQAALERARSVPNKPDSE